MSQAGLLNMSGGGGGGSPVLTLTGNSGGPISPTGNNINTVGTGSITIAGSGSTLTTQLTGTTNHALQVGAGTATLTQLATGSTGQVLQSSGASSDPAWSTATYPSTAGSNGNVLTSNGTNFVSQALPTKVTTINGDSGSVSGSTVSILGHTGSSGLAGSSVSFKSTSGTELDLELVDASDNLFIGRVAGNGSLTGSNSVGLGTGAFQNYTSGMNNVGVGYICLNHLQSGQQNVGVGTAALATLATNSANTGIGYDCLTSATGSQNTGLGANSLISLVGGSNNCSLGFNSGTAYTGSESSNITLMNAGTAAESNVMRLGTAGSGAGQVNACYIAGITGVTPSNIQPVGINSSTGQVGVIPTVASNEGTSAAPTGTSSTAAYVMMGLGSSWKLTPTTFTSARITINGQMTNGTTGDGINIIMAFGTGTAPINGAAVTGTAVGINTIWTALTGLLTNGVPFSKTYIVTGLSAGTAYWFDLQCKAITGGTASVLNLEFTAQELQS